MRDRTIDMTQGSILRHIVKFTVPTIFSGILQISFNVADTAILGLYVGDTALAAVGSLGSVISMISTLCLGLSTAASILEARAIGSGNKQEISRTAHTALAVSIVCGLILATLGIAFSGSIVRLMGGTDETIKLSTL